MTRSIVVGLAGAIVAVAMLGLGYVAGRTGEAGAPPVETARTADRAEIEAIVRSYLIENPEVMIEVQTALETRQRDQQRLTQRTTISEASGDIFSASYDGVVGNPDGKITIVEFYDYNCGYCKRALADMEAMVKDHDDLRFVLKEFPILGPESQKAHVVSMAFHALAPEKFGAFHRELLGAEGRAGEEKAIEIALSHGVDEAALRAEMQNPAIMESFGVTYELANKLAITGTPSYVIGDEVVFGALGADVLAEKINNVRTCQSATC